MVEDSNWEPDGVTLQVRFCEESGTSLRMTEILWHRRETRRPTENTNFCLPVGKNPAYSPGLAPKPGAPHRGTGDWGLARAGWTI
jgi:hypothetical protein